MKITELKLETHCLQQMMDFYSNVLGFALLDTPKEAFTVQAGFTRFIFKKSRNLSRPFYHFAFNVPANLFSDSMSWLSARGVQFLSAGDGEILIDQGPRWNAHSCYFHDPAGNIAEFIARHRLPDTEAQQFSIEQVMGVSEIGIPVTNPSNTVHELISHCGVDTAQDESDPDFVGLGSDDGLLIVVNHKRPWFPSRDSPVMSPVEAKIETGHDGYVAGQEEPYHLDSF